LWKVRLNSPPKHLLEYFFMRSSFDLEDLEARHNIIETRAETAKQARFDKAIEGRTDGARRRDGHPALYLRPKQSR
jgi:hypothetical protein